MSGLTSSAEEDQPQDAIKKHEQATELVPRTIEADPSYVSALLSSKILGFERLPNCRIPSPRYYTLNLNAFRGAIGNIMSKFLRICFAEQDILTNQAITDRLEQMIPIIVNACVSALYAKLHNIHKSFGTYANFFPTTPTYNEEMELPLPFADAIHNFGVYTPSGSVNYYDLIPVYPENIQSEGTTGTDSDRFESCVSVLKDLGVPLKCVDTEAKSGTAWRTLRPVKVHGTVDLRCVFSPINYPDHDVITALMFLFKNEQGIVNGVVDPRDDDQKYPYRASQITEEDPLRAFANLFVFFI